MNFLTKHKFLRAVIYILLTLTLGTLGVSPKRAATWAFVIVWFLHLLIAAGAGYAAWRLWPERENKFVNFTMIHLHAAIVDGLSAIVLIFLATSVVFTWKFSLALFSLALIRDIVRAPLIFYIIRGPSGTNGGDTQTANRMVQSGELSPDFWEEKMLRTSVAAIRSEIKPDLLK